MRLKNKVVPVIANPQAGDCCLVTILDFDFQKFPERAKMEDLFYMQPLPQIPSIPGAPWFKNQVVGKNTR